MLRQLTWDGWQLRREALRARLTQCTLVVTQIVDWIPDPPARLLSLFKASYERRP